MRVPGAEAAACSHLPDRIAVAGGQACEDCGSEFDLRLCVHCGYVGCCESQSGHDRSHALGRGHPVIMSLPVTEDSFAWCYTCRSYV